MKKILLFAAAALALLGCSKEDVAPQADIQAIDVQMPVFHATTEGTPVTGTKVYADEDLKVLWNSRDSIKIYNRIHSAQLYEFTGEDGDTGGDFEFVSGSTAGTRLDHIYAIYPSTICNSFDTTLMRMSVRIPMTQYYKENSFGIKANPMVAVSDDYSLQFKNVCGYLKIRLWGNNVKVKKINITSTSNQHIALSGWITPVFDGEPTISFSSNASSTGINMVCPNVTLGGSSTEATDFIFVVPPVTSRFRVTVTDELGGTFTKTMSNSITITRNRMESMEPLEVIPNYDNVSVQFNDEIFESYCLENFDTDSDGKISYTEALAVGRIDVFNKGISSLKGIEYFGNITSLSASCNQLTELDLSHNTALDTLKAGQNQLSELDLSNNTSLKYLQCYSNSLSELDLSNNIALTSVECDNNQISVLDLSKLTALAYLNCESNQLTSLNVRNNHSLQGLICGKNLFRTLDVSALSSLTVLDCQNHTNLVNLYCENCNLSQCRLSGTTALQNLNCDNNNLTYLNLYLSSNLQYLSCTGNNFTALDVSRSIGELTVTAWPQTGTLSTIKVAPGNNVTYKAWDGGTHTYTTIDPADYGTTVIIYEYEDYKTITYSEFYYVNEGTTAFESRPGSVDENLDGTWAKLQKARNDDSQYKLILFSGAASIEFHTGTSTIGDMYVDKYIGYNDAISYDSSTKLVEFTITVNGHTYLFQIRTAKCTIPTGTINSGDRLEIEGNVKKDGAWYPNGYNTWQMLTVD